MATSSTKGAANRKGITDILVGRKLLTERQLQPAGLPESGDQPRAGRAAAHQPDRRQR